MCGVRCGLCGFLSLDFAFFSFFFFNCLFSFCCVLFFFFCCFISFLCSFFFSFFFFFFFFFFCSFFLIPFAFFLFLSFFACLFSVAFVSSRIQMEDSFLSLSNYGYGEVGEEVSCCFSVFQIPQFEFLKFCFSSLGWGHPLEETHFVLNST